MIEPNTFDLDRREQPPDADGYEPDSVPLWGHHVVKTECCRCETLGPKDCGCAFGQCAQGLIF